MCLKWFTLCAVALRSQSFSALVSSHLARRSMLFELPFTHTKLFLLQRPSPTLSVSDGPMPFPQRPSPPTRKTNLSRPKLLRLAICHHNPQYHHTRREDTPLHAPHPRSGSLERASSPYPFPLFQDLAAYFIPLRPQSRAPLAALAAQT